MLVIRCIVACHNLNGPALYPVKVQCSQEQFAAGEHYDAARECIEDNHKVSGPFWMCDEKDHSGLIPLLNINWENKDVDLTHVSE